MINEVAEENRVLDRLPLKSKCCRIWNSSCDGVEKQLQRTASVLSNRVAMEAVKATEAMQRAQRAATSTVGASSSVSTAAESLKRLQTRQAEAVRLAWMLLTKL
ncbi:PspA/IM30 family protein [Escherichia coli]